MDAGQFFWNFEGDCTLESNSAGVSLMINLLSPLRSDSLSTQNRFVMGAVLRLRADIHSGVPRAYGADYYRQRAGAGLLISEPLHISVSSACGAGSAGMFDRAHVRAWRRITEGVHRQGGKIFANLYHAGRMSHANLQINHGQPMAPSRVQAQRSFAYQIDQFGAFRRARVEVPRAMSRAEIAGIVTQFAHASEMAMLAGFDGVEINAGHGFLIDQFLRSEVNLRCDGYGGSRDKRARFAREVTMAVGEAIGFNKVGLLISPEVICHDMADVEILPTGEELVQWASGLGLCYLNCALTCLECSDIPSLAGSKKLRDYFDGLVIWTGNWTFDQCDRLLAQGQADLFGFDRTFIANPDLPLRYGRKAALSSLQLRTLYGGGATGYVDYPCGDGSAAA